MPAPSLRDLRKKCRTAGLDDNGSKQDIVDRLQEYEAHNFCEAFLVTKSMIAATEEEIKSNAKKSFEETLQENSLEVLRERGELYVGNLRGLGLAGLKERMQLVEEEQTSTRARLKQKDEEIASLKAEVAGLNVSVATLKHATQDYKRVRARFLSVFKRDILEIKTPWDKFIIDSGNIIVHEGDVLIDALLYDFNGVGSRTDFFVFTELYDINPQEVLKINHEPTIAVINHYGTVRSNSTPGQKANPEYLAKYKRFIRELQCSGLAVDYLLADPTANPTRAAYDALHTCPPYLKAE